MAIEKSVIKLTEKHKDKPDLATQIVLSGGMLQISTQEYDGRTVHFWTVPPLAMMQIMPCWTVAADKVIFASNLQMCNMTAGRIVSEAGSQNSIRDNQKFKRATAGLRPNLLSLEYTDSQTGFRLMMVGLQQYWPMVGMLAGKAGLYLPSVLPVVDDVIKDMGPTVSYSWAADDGIHSLSRGPGVTEGVGSVVGAAFGGGLAVSILMPALSKARQQAKEIVCATQLRQIGLGIIMYQSDNNGKSPPNLEVLIKGYDLTPEMFVCPSSGDKEGQCSYVYRGADLNETAKPQMVVAYDKKGNHRSGKRNVLFVDGHVQAMTENRFQKAIAEDNEIRLKMGLKEKAAADVNEK